MALVRNATSRACQLVAIVPNQGPGSFQSECVTIGPGEQVELEDWLLGTDNGLALVSEGVLEIVGGKAVEVEAEGATAESDPQPARGRKRRGGE